MPPVPEQPTPAPLQPATPSTAIKAIRIFLLVLIFIGLGLIATEQLWVPKLVDDILQNQTQSNSKTSVVKNVSVPWLPLSLIENPASNSFGQQTAEIFTDKNGQVNYQGSAIKGSDASSFLAATDPIATTSYNGSDMTVIFAKDTGHVYAPVYSTTTVFEIISDADSATFLPLYGASGFFAGYAKDKNHIYYVDSSNGGRVNELTSADPNSFVVISGPVGLTSDPTAHPEQDSLQPLSKDTNHVYIGTTSVPNVDAPTFASVNGNYNYFKDKNTVYWYYDRGDTIGLFALPNVDSATFTIFSKDSLYSMDKSHVYLTNRPIEGADPVSFSVFLNGGVNSTDYERDKSSIYFLDKKMVGVDYATFSIPDPYPSDFSYDAQDKNHKYQNGQIIQ